MKTFIELEDTFTLEQTVLGFTRSHCAENWNVPFERFRISAICTEAFLKVPKGPIVPEIRLWNYSSDAIENEK